MGAPRSAPKSQVLPPTDPEAGRDALLTFACAFLFLLLGLAALFWNSGRLAQGMFADSRVVGGLHWITLGWLSLSIFGALRVFTGVALGTQGLRRGLFLYGRGFWVLGTIVFPLSLICDLHGLIPVGALLIGVAILFFTAHLAPALLRPSRGKLTRAFLVVSVISLWCTWLLGGGAALARAGVTGAALLPGYFRAHLLLALFGWVGGAVLGVGSHLIPMFALSKEPRHWPVKTALGFWILIPVFGIAGAFHPYPFLDLGWAAACIGSVLWLIQAALFFRSRLRRERDPGLFLAGSATVLMAFAWMGIAGLRMPVPSLGLLLVGWLTLFTLGIYHRIIPFLIWFARFAGKAGRGPVPQVRQLTSGRLGFFTAISCLCGVAIWFSGLMFSRLDLIYLGSAALFVGAFLALGQGRSLCSSAKNS